MYKRVYRKSKAGEQADVGSTKGALRPAWETNTRGDRFITEFYPTPAFEFSGDYHRNWDRFDPTSSSAEPGESGATVRLLS